MNKRHSLAISCVALLALIGCQPKARSMTPEESARMATITSKPAPRCVGRYLIDLPQVFELNPVHLTTIEGVKVAIQPTTRAAFDLALQKRRAELDGERMMYERSKNSLVRIVQLSGDQGVVFDRSESQVSLVLRVWELFAWRNGYVIKMMIEHQDATQEEPPTASKTTTEERLDHLLKLFARTRPRDDLEIPTEQGVCFANGFVGGPPTDQESIVMRYTVRAEEDGQFIFHVMSGLGAESDTLLDRLPAIRAELQESKGRVLRSSRIKVNGLEVDEVLRFRPHEQTKIDTYAFVAEMNSKQGNAQAPFFGIDFGSGYGRSRPPESLDAMASRPPLQKAIFNEAESVAVWDAALSTLRKRPGAF